MSSDVWSRDGFRRRAPRFGASASSAARTPIPGQQLVDTIDRVSGDSRQHVVQVGLRIKAIHLGALCRHPNYAERFWTEPVAPAYLRAVERTSIPCHSA